MNPISIFGHLNYILTICAYMVKDMLKLRILAIFAGCCGIVYSLFYTNSILWVELIWETAGISVNSFHIIRLLRERNNLFLTKEEAELYNGLFHMMNVFDFKKLISHGVWTEFEENETIINEGQSVSKISVIGSGMAEIISGKRVVAHCQKGALLGEMSYVTGEPATATVRAAEKTRCLQWDHDKLRTISAKNSALLQGFQIAMNENLIRKLQRHKEDPIR